MAELQTTTGIKTRSIQEIQRALAPINIELNEWPIENSTKEKMKPTVLNDSEKESILKDLDHYFEDLKSKLGYQSRDLIVLHPGIPNLDVLLKKFDRIHTHDDDEVRYIVDGAGIFGFVLPDGDQILLTVEAGEFINVPKDTEHWFILTPEKKVKAVRYFTGTDGWVPNYTDKEKRI